MWQPHNRSCGFFALFRTLLSVRYFIVGGFQRFSFGKLESYKYEVIKKRQVEVKVCPWKHTKKERKTTDQSLLEWKLVTQRGVTTQLLHEYERTKPRSRSPHRHASSLTGGGHISHMNSIYNQITIRMTFSCTFKGWNEN